MSDMDLFEIDWAVQDKNNEIELDLNFLFQEIEQELSNLLSEPKSGEDATDGAFAFIENLTNHLQAEFYKPIGDCDSDKKQFIKSLTTIFAILLNTKVGSVDKIEKIIKVAISTVVKIWPGGN